MSLADNKIGVELGKINSIRGAHGRIAVHPQGRGLGEIGMPHSRDITYGAEKHPARHGGCHIRDCGFFEAVILEGPCDARGLGCGVDVGTVPNPAPGGVEDVGRIEGVDSDIPLPANPAIIGPAKPGPNGAIVVVLGVGAPIPTVLRVPDHRPRRSPVCRLKILVRPTPPI